MKKKKENKIKNYKLKLCENIRKTSLFQKRNKILHLVFKRDNNKMTMKNSLQCTRIKLNCHTLTILKPKLKPCNKNTTVFAHWINKKDLGQTFNILRHALFKTAKQIIIVSFHRKKTRLLPFEMLQLLDSFWQYNLCQKQKSNKNSSTPKGIPNKIYSK